MRKRIIALILLAALSVSVGCGGGEVTYAEGEDPYEGQWSDPNNPGAYLDVWKDDEGKYYGILTWTEDWENVVFLDFEGRAERKGLVLSGCKRVDTVYDDMGDPEETTIYDNSTGLIESNDDKLTIDIEGDSIAEGCVFEYEGSY